MRTIGQPLISAPIPVLVHEIDRAALGGRGLSKLLSVPHPPHPVSPYSPEVVYQMLTL